MALFKNLLHLLTNGKVTKMSIWFLILTIGLIIPGGFTAKIKNNTGKTGIKVDDQYRPEIHFSIPEFWINDPNGMVYLDGEYHLHYQYNPDDSVWGPMHWGHSISTDLIRWQHLPIALYPDELGQIFSGSAVADLKNSSGLQEGTRTPMIAVFTHAGSSQQQSLAYSNDNGRTFKKYNGNPVVPNPGMNDFRDPKVIPYDDSWVMVLAAGQKVMLYKSIDLKNWEYLSEFGENPSQGAHTGVWECPDLIKLTYSNVDVWVLLVSVNPGGPNGGSNTQYFIGDFDGKTFKSSQIQPLWMDWGTDNYAGVTFSNEPQGRNIMMAWMNNWDYANILPTNGWRGQMTLPREFSLQLAQGQLRLKSQPPKEVEGLYNAGESVSIIGTREIAFDSVLNLTQDFQWSNPLMYLDISFDIEQFGPNSHIAICFMNSVGQEICTGHDQGVELSIFVDRVRTGNTGFHSSFARRPTAHRETRDKNIRFQIYMDVSALELFVDSGLTCLTTLFYPDDPFTNIQIRHHAEGDANSKLIVTEANLQGLKSILKK